MSADFEGLLRALGAGQVAGGPPRAFPFVSTPRRCNPG